MTESVLCPKGHVSTEADYCSACGAKIGGAPVVQTAEALDSPEQCPDCGADREQTDIAFCEVCGYNFLTGVRGEIPGFAAPATASPENLDSLVVTSPSPLASGEPPIAEAALVPPPQRWEVTATVDSALREPGSPAPPAGMGPFVFALTQPVSLIGRRSETRAIFPEIALSFDDAVSHRHALLQLDPGGALRLRDIGAANGTRLNGREVTPMVDHPLGDGDIITLGHWTQLVVRVAGEASA